MLNFLRNLRGQEEGGRTKRQGDRRWATRPHEAHQKLGSPEAHSVPDDRKGRLMKRVEDTKYKSGLPEEVISMADHIDSHNVGTLFKYAVITDKASSGREDAITKLRSFKPKREVADMHLSDIPAIRMQGDCLDLKITSAITKVERSRLLPYTALDCILVHFVPLDSFTNEGSVVTVQLNDNRKVSDSIVRSATFLDTTSVNILFFLDYYIETKDLDQLSLSFSCSKTDFVAGTAWGATKVILTMSGATFPRRLGIANTRGVVLLSDTDLESYDTDPRHADLVLTPKVLQGLRSMNMRGEVENRTVRLNDGLTVSTAKTMMLSEPENMPIGSLMSGMKREAVKNSLPARSALKPSTSHSEGLDQNMSSTGKWAETTGTLEPPSDLSSPPDQEFVLPDREIVPDDSASVSMQGNSTLNSMTKRDPQTRPKISFA